MAKIPYSHLKNNDFTKAEFSFKPFPGKDCKTIIWVDSIHKYEASTKMPYSEFVKACLKNLCLIITGNLKPDL